MPAWLPDRPVSRALLGLCALFLAGSCLAQSGLRPPKGDGLDPTFARGWLAPDYDQFGFLTQWREPFGFAPAPRMNWSYSFNQRGSLGMSYTNGREFDLEQRQMSVFGRYWVSPDWALSAESMSREPGGLLRLQDFRIGVHRRF